MKYTPKTSWIASWPRTGIGAVIGLVSLQMTMGAATAKATEGGGTSKALAAQ